VLAEQVELLVLLLFFLQSHQLVAELIQVEVLALEVNGMCLVMLAQQDKVGLEELVTTMFLEAVLEAEAVLQQSDQMVQELVLAVLAGLVFLHLLMEQQLLVAVVAVVV
jgi:hypothetical protein